MNIVAPRLPNMCKSHVFEQLLAFTLLLIVLPSIKEHGRISFTQGASMHIAVFVQKFIVTRLLECVIHLVCPRQKYIRFGFIFGGVTEWSPKIVLVVMLASSGCVITLLPK